MVVETKSNLRKGKATGIDNLSRLLSVLSGFVAESWWE
jgi:hypothetical protein